MRYLVRPSITLDPAMTDNKRSDFSGIIVNLTDERDIWHIHEADNFKGKPDAVVQRMVYYARLYRPAEIGIESVAAQALYKHLLIPELRTHGITCPIREIRYPTFLKKEAKTQSLQPRFKQQKIRIRRPPVGSSGDGLRELIRQLDQFPELDHDDLLDALVLQKDVSRAPDPHDITYTYYAEDDEDDDEEAEPDRRKLTGAWVGLSTPARR